MKRSLWSVWIALNVLFIPPTLLCIASLFSGQTDSGLILVVAWPLVLCGILLLVIDGILMVVYAIKPGKPLPKTKRIIIGVAGSLPPLLFLGLLALFFFAQIEGNIIATRVETPISNMEASQLVQSCKVSMIKRETRNGRFTGILDLKRDALDFFESNFSRLGESGYRLFDANYYDQLLRIVRSPQVRTDCSNIATNYLTDKEYQSWPAEIKWVTADEVGQMLQTCAIDELHYGSPPHEIATYNPPHGILFYKVQEPSGPYSQVYTEYMAETDKTKIFDLARNKQTTCQYHRPAIVLP